MKIEWPWTKNRRRIAALETRLRELEDALCEARVLRLPMVVDYKPGMSLDDPRPEPIDLAALQERTNMAWAKAFPSVTYMPFRDLQRGTASP